MASVQIVHHWGADEMTIVTVTAKTSYPDALNEAKATAISAFEEAVRLVTDAQAIAEP